MIAISFFILLLFITTAADIYISVVAKKKSYDRTKNIPTCDYGLVLGTAKYIGENKSINIYYQYRIDAALALWRAGKIKQFIVSGSGLDEKISETVCMQHDLEAGGVPSDAIWQDIAGLRTLDSILRYQQQFDSHNVCIISQPFHNQRALVQAHALNACAYNAQIVGVKAGWRVHLRERAARLRLWYDLITRQKAQYSISEIPIQQINAK